nr:zinc finger, CCHC-type [Tanacetum cinerariifolium]
MAAAAMKHIASSFAKQRMKVKIQLWNKSGRGPSGTMMIMSVEDTLEAKYMVEDASSKKFLVSNFINYKMTDSRLVLEQYNKLLEMLEREINSIELGNHLRIEESLKVHDSDKPKSKNVTGPSVVNMVEHNNSSRYNDHKGKHKHNDNRANPNKKPKVTCWKCGKYRHFKRITRLVDSGATVHVCKDKCWFNTYESLNDGSIILMRNKSTALVHGRGYVDLKISSGKVVSLLNVLHVPNIRKNLV